MKKIRVDMTSSPFRGAAGLRNLDACRETAESLGFEFGVQLHNTASAAEIDALRHTGVRLSAHAPLNACFNWNLAAENVDAIMESVAENVRLFHQLAIGMSVFHGFVMTDRPVPAFGHGRGYDECMSEIFRPELTRSGLRINCDYFGTAEFALRRDRVRDRLAELRRRFPEITFCIENDFPAYGSSCIFADQMALLEHPVCLDTGHLWMSCRLYDREFHREAAAFLATGRVRMIHLHASKYDEHDPLEKWGDGHLPLAHPNRMDLPRFVRACRAAAVDWFVLEIVAGTPDDLRKLAEYLA